MSLRSWAVSSSTRDSPSREAGACPASSSQAQVLAGKDDAGDDALQLDTQDLEAFGRERYGSGAAVHDATSTVREVP